MLKNKKQQVASHSGVLLAAIPALRGLSWLRRAFLWGQMKRLWQKFESGMGGDILGVICLCIIISGALIIWGGLS